MRKTAEMSGIQYGDWVESETQAGLDNLMTRGGSFFTRLYDSRSAGSLLPPQVGDFIGCHAGRGFLLEVKASVVHASLAEPGAMRKLIKSHQALGSYLMQRSGGQGLFLFRSRVSQGLEIWDGAKVREAFVTPRAKLPTTPDCLLIRTVCLDADFRANFEYMFNRIFQP